MLSLYTSLKYRVKVLKAIKTSLGKNCQKKHFCQKKFHERNKFGQKKIIWKFSEGHVKNNVFSCLEHI